VAVDEQSDVSIFILQETLPWYWQLIFVGFIGFYPQNCVRVTFGRWRRMTRSAIAALAVGELIN